MRRFWYPLILAVTLAFLIPSLGRALGDTPHPTATPTPGSLTGDFNGDGYADLAAGVRSEDVGGVKDAGAVSVIYGSAAGLTAAGPPVNQFWNQDSPGLAGTAHAGDQFGFSVAVGDFNADGFSDLAVGIPLKDLGTKTDAGDVAVLYGSSGGLASVGNQVWSMDSTGVLGVASRFDEFGWAVTTGDFNGDGFSDLAVGALGHAIGSASNAGSVSVIYGSGAGLVSAGSQFFSQNTPGIPGAAATNDNFGFALIGSDFGNGPQSDLAIGNPFDDPSGKVDAGSVNVIYGGVSGLTATGSQMWTQDSPSIVGTAEGGDLFGYDVAAGDFGNSAEGDLAIGVVDESGGGLIQNGAVNVIYGSAAGLTASGNQLFTGNLGGSSPASGAGFGNSLAAANFGNGSQTDLAIGSAGLNVGSAAAAGAVEILYGSVAGLTATGSQEWDQDTATILDQAETNDFFGADVAAADFNNDGNADLAVGVTFEDIGSIKNAGAINVIYGSAGGLTDTGPPANQFWSQGANGIIDTAEAGDQFAFAVA